jgi:hypothetical protein
LFLQQQYSLIDGGFAAALSPKNKKASSLQSFMICWVILKTPSHEFVRFFTATALALQFPKAKAFAPLLLCAIAFPSPPAVHWLLAPLSLLALATQTARMPSAVAFAPLSLAATACANASWPAEALAAAPPVAFEVARTPLVPSASASQPVPFLPLC